MKRFRIQGLPAKLVLSLLHGLFSFFSFFLFGLLARIWFALASGDDIDWWDLICEQFHRVWTNHDLFFIWPGYMALGALLGILFQSPPRLEITFNVLFLSLLTVGVVLAVTIGFSTCSDWFGWRYLRHVSNTEAYFFMGFFSLISYGVCYRLALSTGFLKRVYPAGCCEHCGYDLRATLEGTCPECGQAFMPIVSDNFTKEK